MKFLSLILVLLSLNARADIMFLDLNNNPLEIAAAKRAADKRGERLLVYPQVNKEQAALIASYRQRLEVLQRDYEAATTDADRERLRTEYRNVDEERRTKVQEVTFGPEQLKTVLGQLSADGTKLSSVIISGHDGNNDFSGSQGYMYASSFNEAFAQYPELADGVESLFLAGCYTVKPGTLEYQFQDTFKNLNVIAGYDDAAPLGDKPAGHQYIENFLTRESNLEGLEGESAIRREVRKIIPSALGTNASMCLEGSIYVERDQFMDMSEAWKNCDENAQKVRDGAEMFNCYANAGSFDYGLGIYTGQSPQQNGEEPSSPRGGSPPTVPQSTSARSCDNPPEDTRNGELRAYYNVMQEIAPCKYKPGFEWRDFPDPERMIRLIYHKKVAKAFSRAFASDLKDSVQVLIDAGVPKEVAEKIQHLEAMSRKELLEYLAMLEGQYGYERNRTGNEKIDKARLALDNITRGLRSHLANLDPRCVPLDWVDAGNQKSLCANSTLLGSKAVKQAETTFERVRIGEEIDRLRRERDNLRSGSTYSYGVEQDPVVSDQAVEATIMQNQGQSYDLRIENLYDQSNMIEYRNALAQLPDTEAGRRDRKTYEEEIARIEQRIAERSARLATLDPDVNIETLRRDRRAFFREALEAVESDSQGLTRMKEELEYYRSQIQRYDERIAAATDEIDRARLLQKKTRWEEEMRRFEAQVIQREQHVTYIREMSALLESEGGNPEAQARISEILQARIKAMRDERVAHINRNLSYYQEEVAWCNARPGRCDESGLQAVQRQIDRMTEQIRQMESAHDMGY
jgi:hypothetical protein